MEIIRSAYNTLFYERADPRVSDWLLMTSPKPVAAIIAVYLVLIKFLLPAYMRNRKPYELRSVIKWYNVVQIISNVVVAWGIMTSGWTTTYHFGCELPDYSMNPEALRMLRFLWWTMIIKILELVETVFFKLRKKEKQASFLHIYHHISSLVLIWSAVKYVGGVHDNNRDRWLKVLSDARWGDPQGLHKHLDHGKHLYGGMTSFTPMVNCAVHVIMYSYYLLSAEGSPTVKAYLARYKKWLTIMQMVQFTVVLVYSAQVFLPSCPAPLGITYMYFPSVIIVYYMFYDFFKKSYKKPVHKI